jgi:hypothetical protein
MTGYRYERWEPYAALAAGAPEKPAFAQTAAAEQSTIENPKSKIQHCPMVVCFAVRTPGRARSPPPWQGKQRVWLTRCNTAQSVPARRHASTEVDLFGRAAFNREMCFLPAARRHGRGQVGAGLAADGRDA